ncbi:MAG: hypothetical protein GX144_07235 [Clostridiaceae bacterium]|nr:hypothetical protein [Clostridiaceae bacterium]
MKKETDKKVKTKKETEETEPVFRFFLSDGREVQTLEGLVVPVTEKTEAAYRLLSEME